MTRAYDAVVVGAGPAGSITALLLSRLGYRVALVDRAHFPRTKPCGEYLSPGVGQVLAHLGLSHVLEDAHPLSVPGMEIVGPRGELFRVQYSRAGRSISASTLPRRLLDARLLSAAVQAGADLIEGFVARKPVVTDAVVTGIMGSDRGRPASLHGRITIVADGARSVMARSLGLAELPRWPVRMGLVAHFEGKAALNDGFGQMHVRPEGYCGIAPLPGNLVNVAIVVPTDALRLARVPATALLDRWIAETPRLRTSLAQCTRVSPVRGVSPLGSRCCRAYAPGALLVGDAASFFDPFTGEGIYRALRGAELAAQTAHSALVRGDVSAQALAPYQHLRTRAFRSKEVVTGLVQLFVQYPGLMSYALPRLSTRERSAHTLSAVLGDIQDAKTFLSARSLWGALRP